MATSGFVTSKVINFNPSFRQKVILSILYTCVLFFVALELDLCNTTQAHKNGARHSARAQEVSFPRPAGARLNLLLVTVQVAGARGAVTAVHRVLAIVSTDDFQTLHLCLQHFLVMFPFVVDRAEREGI